MKIDSLAVVQDVAEVTTVRFRCYCMTSALYWERWLKRVEPETNPRIIPNFIANWQEIKAHGSASN